MGVKLQSSSGGSVDITAPVTASNYTLTAPAANGTILNDASSLAAAMLTGNVDVARLVSAFSGSNVSLGTNGYQKLPSGLILQWGISAEITQGSTLTLSFPIAFLAAPYSICVQAKGSAPSASSLAGVPKVGSFSTTGFAMYMDRTDISTQMYWMAIGN